VPSTAVESNAGETLHNMAAVRSVTFLCDSPASQTLFANILLSLGFRTLWEAQPLSALKRSDVTSLGVQCPGVGLSQSADGACAIELLSLNSADAYRFNKKVRELKLLSLNVAALDAVPEALAGASVDRLPDFTNGQAGGLFGSAVAHATGLFKRIGASTGIGILPEVVFAEQTGTLHSPVDTVGANSIAHPTETASAVGSLLEIVVGLPHARQAAMEQALRARGFNRNRRALSVWGGATAPEGGPSVRILPAAYTKPFSALVMQGDAAAVVEAKSDIPLPGRACSEGVVGGGSVHTPLAPLVSAGMYGMKGGLPSASQGQVTSALLPGLDIRVQGGAAPAPYFNESQDVYGEDVDLSLNPGHGDVPPLACRSIVGMELTASWKRRMRFLQNL